MATGVMTGVLLAARRVGLADPPAPEAVFTGMLEKLDLNEEVRPPLRTALVTVAHLGYGMALGGVFATVLGRTGASSTLRGCGFGMAVWVLDYLGWLPAAGIMPPPSRQGAGRHLEACAGHLVYGGTLGALTARSRRVPSRVR